MTAEDPYSVPLMDEEFIRYMIKMCDEERAAGKYKSEVDEGDRLASQFRTKFPDVSDKDLGTMLVVLVRVVGLVANSTVATAAMNIDKTLTCYSHAAAVILKSVIDLRDL